MKYYTFQEARSVFLMPVNSLVVDSTLEWSDNVTIACFLVGDQAATVGSEGQAYTIIRTNRQS